MIENHAFFIKYAAELVTLIGAITRDGQSDAYIALTLRQYCWSIVPTLHQAFDVAPTITLTPESLRCLGHEVQNSMQVAMYFLYIFIAVYNEFIAKKRLIIRKYSERIFYIFLHFSTVRIKKKLNYLLKYSFTNKIICKISTEMTNLRYIIILTTLSKKKT